MSDEIILDTKELAKVQPSKVDIPTFNLLPEGSPSLSESLPEFDFANPPTNPTAFASSLVETCIKNRGLGLSANQCGFPYRVFVAGAEDNYVAYFNPKVISMSQEETLGDEGCLSFPNLFLKVYRPNWVKIEYQDFNGEKHTEQFEGLTARVLLHEIDHMNGITFNHRTKPMALKSGLDKRDKLMYRIERAAKAMKKATAYNAEFNRVSSGQQVTSNKPARKSAGRGR
jgi:peptide deformylase